MEETALNEYKKSHKKNIDVSRRVAEEGIVLLVNRNRALPLAKGERISVYGTAQINYIHTGGGSGNVLTAYVANVLDALSQEDVEINEKLAECYRKCVSQSRQEQKAAMHNMTSATALIPEIEWSAEAVKEQSQGFDTAVYVMSRVSEEGMDRKLEKGDYFLTDAEETLIQNLRASYKKVVCVLNLCGIMDMEWLERYQIDAAILCGLNGMVGAEAAAEVLTGRVNPSGKLTDTYALDYWDYPSSWNFGSFVEGYEQKVGTEDQFRYWGFIPQRKPAPLGEHYERPVGDHFPVYYEEGIYNGYRYFETFGKTPRFCFGYGLSYTDFTVEYLPEAFRQETDGLRYQVKVTNVGAVSGKEVVQVYGKAPEGRLQKADRVLADFLKTRLLAPGESQVLEFFTSYERFASFSEEAGRFVCEAGEYSLYIGNSVAAAQRVQTFSLEGLEFAPSARLHAPSLPLRKLEKGMDAEVFLQEGLEEKEKGKEYTVWQTPGPEPDVEVVLDPPKEVRYRLADVYRGNVSMDAFLDQFTLSDLIVMIVGVGMGKTESLYGPLNKWVPGGAGFSPYLERFGIPTIFMSDGPAGIHTEKNSVSFPTGTAVGSTWNRELAFAMGEAVGDEGQREQVDYWLAPSFNIHRNPLCGRNFEYVSEDPVLSGEIAAQLVKGVQSKGVGACVKHFAVNNQETNRFENTDSIVSEQALREIYLKAFEIVVKEAKPWSLMTSYNLINGVYASACKDLVTDVLRGEWGYEGFVVTDWEGDGIHTEGCIHAGTDLFMPGFSGQMAYIRQLAEEGRVGMDELKRCAGNFLRGIMRTKTFTDYIGETEA